MERVRVAVALILNEHQEVLISRRQGSQHLAGFWEFPGGKIEAQESAYEALVRELKEELALNIQAARFLFHLDYDYPEKSVRLEIFDVGAFTGNAWGCEGQEVLWCKTQNLNAYTFPPANMPIVEYLLGL